jgi:hypothetical protein
MGPLVRIMSVFYGCLVIPHTENDIDVFGRNGEYMLRVRHGVCESEKFGCTHRLTLDPIPRATRLFKEVKGKLVKDDQFNERLKLRKEFLDSNGIVKAMSEMPLGYIFDAKGDVAQRPAKPAPVVEQASQDLE